MNDSGSPDPSAGRYARLRTISWWNMQTVRDAVAVVVGAGALGNEVVKNLALLGWGKVWLVDFDTIDMSNLTRSVFFRPDDVGRPKNGVVAEAASRLNPDTNVECLDGDLRIALSPGLVKRSDVVFGCVDNVAARLALGRLAGQAGVRWIDGGLAEAEGTVSLFHPPEGACYGCGLTEDDLKDLRLRYSCPAYAARVRARGGVPTTPVVASIIAALMVQQGLKIVHGLDDPAQLPIGHQLRIDVRFSRFWKAKLWVRPDCRFHPTPIEAEVLPGVSDRTTWRDILARIRHHFADETAVLHLPQPVLECWTCQSCGRSARVERISVEGENVLCTDCARPVAPTLFNQVTGAESWIDKTPAATGFPPFTWLSAASDTALQHVEITRG
jgi:molybdopterin/thiamine biosynthesis adenylyltransferase